MKRLLLLGATGSIGTTCLNALRNNLAEDIVLAGITAKDSPSLIDRAREFDVPYLYLTGGEGGKLSEFIEKTHPDIILNAIAGSDGLGATLECIKHSIPIALANKESVVMGGEFMLSQAKAFGTEIIPVDSEHSAIYHLLKAKRADRLIITASGGPFVDRMDLSSVTVEEALHHPTWSMGKKITIDSATLANKGLEVIEASLLFDFPAEKIDVTIHRQSIIHSAIETEEGAVYALLSTPDMTLPVLLALQGEGTGLKNVVKRLSFSTPLSLTFEGWDRERFPLLSLAYKTLEMGSYARIAYCQSDEIAVNAFLLGRIGFTEIASIVEETVMSMPASNVQSYEDIIRIKQIAKQKAEALC
ncbi:MAG: 1-deoxy-D-xylulose-5-phosphate reductoisomerase [Spirochaetes bacterium]|uniref:1-deoxy-D-xylulose 5-phosphate reductoisomerase n=1 Tax=Candidatus Ornithospirochaeta stercoripullorum TaxID=2840899 RepID=A0A9D9DY20_9SPIO|nr:1-deoxy-D-xylulose-5-phosphate reductoisomerase [Candidatus Ornithospirochaeta stercoripullorum]